MAGRVRTTEPEQGDLSITQLFGRTAKPFPQFRAGESVRDGLVRVASELIGRAVSRIEFGGKNRAEDLHQVRLTVKRLRASLRMVRPVIGKAFFGRENRRLKKVADHLSLLRDAVVSRRTLLKLAGNHSIKQDRKAVALVLARIAEQGPASGQFRERCETALHQVVGSLVEAADNFQNMLILAEEWEAIGLGLHNAYREARDRMSRAARSDQEEEFHDWRKEMKYLYYELQMVQPAWPERLGTMLRRLKKLEEKLGKVHDFAGLRNMLEESPRRYGGRRAVKRVVACLDRQSTRLRRQSQALGKKLFLEKPAKFVAKLNTHWADWRSSGESR